MAYTRVWSEVRPNGATTLAKDIDVEIQYTRQDLRERIGDILGMSSSDFALDPARAKAIKFDDSIDAKILLGDNAGTPRNVLIRNKADAITYYSLGSNSLGLGEAAAVAGFSINSTRSLTTASAIGLRFFTTHSVNGLEESFNLQRDSINFKKNVQADTDVTVGTNTGVARVIAINSAAGNVRDIRFQTAGSIRWILRTQSGAEAGANAGSDFVIAAYDDAGVNIDTPITIVRAAGGSFTVARPLTATSTGQFNGNLTVGTNTGAATTSVNIKAAAGQTRSLIFRTAGNERWILSATATAEAGADAGSDFALQAYNDAGALIDAPISITRVAGGLITLGRPLTITANASSLSVGGVNVSTTDGLLLRGSAGATNQFRLSGSAGTTIMSVATGVLVVNFASTIRPSADLGGDIGTSSLRWSDGYFGSSVRIGGTVAASGAIRLANNTSIAWRNAANSADLSLTLDASNLLVATASIKTGGWFQSAAAIPAGNGLLRAGNTESISWRNAANSSDISIQLDASDLFQIGAPIVTAGSNPATTGQVRFPNNTIGVAWRDSTNTVNWEMILNNSDSWSLRIGAGVDKIRYSNSGGFVLPAASELFSLGSSPATNGGPAIRLQTATVIAWRNNANSANLSALQVNSSDLLIGDSGFLSSSPTKGIGYRTGAGSTVTQITSKATAVTINTVCGAITMQGAALAAGAKVSFVVNNNTVVATDAPYAWIASGGTANAYRAMVTAVAAGSFTITVENITAGSLSEAPVVGFAVNKAVTA